MNTRKLVLCGVLALMIPAALLSGCQPSDPCDPGYREELSRCVPIATGDGDGDGDGDGEGDGDEDGGAEPDAAEPAGTHCAADEGSPAAFGAACDSDADCACPAPVCLPAPLNYCSQISCQNDPGICPAGFTCFNIPEMLQENGVTHVCLRQG